MKKIIRRFKSDYVSVKTGKKCSKFSFFRYHLPLISIPGMLLSFVLPPLGALLMVLAMLSMVFTCPIRLIKKMARPVFGFIKCGDFDDQRDDSLVFIAVFWALSFLLCWAVALFYMFVCPWKLTLNKFDSKFITKEEYNAIYEQQIIQQGIAMLEEQYGKDTAVAA